MSWKSKPSGSMEFERRDEPYLTERVKERLTAHVLPRYEDKRGALLPTLHAVQHEHGWLPPQALDEIAEFLGVAPADVLDTASFYEEYWRRPRGEHVIAVCRSIACEFCNSDAITEACKRELGVEEGETTDDGKFTFMELECLGSCGSAPVALFDERLHENLTPERMREIILEAKQGKEPEVASSTSDLKSAVSS